MASPDSLLPKRLVQLLAELVDRDFSQRLERVFRAAARALDCTQLSHLVPYEPSTANPEPPPNASWEQIKPTIRETLVAIQNLTTAIDRDFPIKSSRSGFYSGATSDERAIAEVTQVFRTIAVLLADASTKMNELLKRPELVANRWSFLGLLQHIREDVRRVVSDGIYVTAATVTPVRREEVIPFAQQDIQRTVALRTAVADFRLSVQSYLNEAERRSVVRDLIIDIDLFMTMPAWRYVRAEPKKELLSLKRALLTASDKAPAPKRDELQGMVQPALTLLRHAVNETSPALMASADRTAIIETQQRIEQTGIHLSLGTGGSRWALANASASAERLRGRDEAFDAFLRQFQRKSISEIPDEQMKSIVVEFSQHLKALSHR